MTDLDAIRAALKRRAIVLEIGGFRPPQSPAASWFGRVSIAAPGEAWPMSHGFPMLPLAQINLTEMPFATPGLEDLEFLTVFIDHSELPTHAPNGTGWALRAYPRLSELREVTPLSTDSPIRPFPMRPTVVEADFPNWEDVNIPLPEQIADTYYDHFDTAGGFKLGGWPTLVQSEIFWAPWNRHPADPRYVFQIDTTAKGNWMWGDNGVGYFGRGTRPGHTGVWTFEWQCY